MQEDAAKAASVANATQVAHARLALKALLQVLTPTTAPDAEERASLSHLEQALVEALAAVRSKLSTKETAETSDACLLASLSSLSLAAPPADNVADVVAVGDAVYAKGTDRSIVKGIVVQIEGDGDVYWVRGDDSSQEFGYPAKAIKRRSGTRRVVTAAAPETLPAAEHTAHDAALAASRIEFKLHRAPARQKTAKPISAPEATIHAPTVAPSPAMPPEPPLRMPRLIAAVDTNELLLREDNVDLREHLLQSFRSRSCDVLVAKQVLNELDGLKRSEDPGLAAAARRANAVLAQAASAGLRLAG